MHRVVAMALVAAVALVGCKKSTPGGRGGDDTFKIVVPAGASQVKQGEAALVKVSVDRGAGFKQGIKLEVKAPAGSGLQVDPEKKTVKAGDKGDVQLEVKAAKDAPLGEQKIQVQGTPDKGDSTQTEFKITVITK
jgi:uncharacterized membrane protein